MNRFAFYFDSSSCTGCKACQVACKDHNRLPVGVTWRRVREVSGGGWERRGDAWVSSVFAYQLSLACNHCQRPICLEVCPAAAYRQRPDGIVILDSSRCLGCRYCGWACPYGTPQYDERLGRTSKCHGCFEQVDAGQPPTCVAACPMRALDFGDHAELLARHGSAGVVFPLPEADLTEPALSVTPHREAGRAAREGARLAGGPEGGEP